MRTETTDPEVRMFGDRSERRRTGKTGHLQCDPVSEEGSGGQ